MIGAHLLVELWRAVILPEPAENAADRGREKRLGGVGVAGAVELLVEVGDVRGA
ncbi:hypothetical protein [Occallatibacter savannae]|uniref:hypothetical protein n=1 Tax=Occallatibacter savannae TaxID=1002691 RepID=UPI0013A53123|nr:hypothetical protein [Occallatibacter savannae]